jgi:hypothetical protein
MDILLYYKSMINESSNLKYQKSFKIGQCTHRRCMKHIDPLNVFISLRMQHRRMRTYTTLFSINYNALNCFVLCKHKAGVHIEM